MHRVTKSASERASKPLKPTAAAQLQKWYFSIYIMLLERSKKAKVRTDDRNRLPLLHLHAVSEVYFTCAFTTIDSVLNLILYNL